MGYDSVRWDMQVYAYVSRHNSPRDEAHDALWEDLKRRLDVKYEEIRAIVNEAKYEPITPGVL